MKRFVADSEHRRVCVDKGKVRKVSARQIHQIKRAAAKMPLQSSKQVFETAGPYGVPQTSRCRILQRPQLSIDLPLSHPKPVLTSRNDYSEPRHSQRLILKQTVLFTD